MTLTLAAATPFVASQLSGTALAQASGGSGGASGGASGVQGAPGSGGAAQRGGAMETQRGNTDRGGVSDPMRRNSGASEQRGTMDRSDTMRRGGSRDRANPMSGSSGADATNRSQSTRGTGAGDAALVGNDKLTAALGALDGDGATNRRRGGAARSARLLQIEEYETAMRNAHALSDPAARSSAIAEARARLTGVSGQALSSDAIARVDTALGLSPAPVTR